MIRKGFFSALPYDEGIEGDMKVLVREEEGCLHLFQDRERAKREVEGLILTHFLPLPYFASESVWRPSSSFSQPTLAACLPSFLSGIFFIAYCSHISRAKERERLKGRDGKGGRADGKGGTEGRRRRIFRIPVGKRRVRKRKKQNSIEGGLS